MEHSIRLTERAVARLKELLEKKNAESSLMLRLTVLSGGCSGFQYSFKLDDMLNEDDVVFETNGTRAVIDQLSLELLNGSIIDYKETMMGSAFTVENANARSSCGCGNSFSL